MNTDELKIIFKSYNIKSDKITTFIDFYNKAKKLELNYPLYYALSKILI